MKNWQTMVVSGSLPCNNNYIIEAKEKPFGVLH
jgi:hypothetical protein